MIKKVSATKLFSTIFIITFIFIMLTSMRIQVDKTNMDEFSTEQMIEAEKGTINGPIQKYSSSEASDGYYLMNRYTSSRKLDDPSLQELPDVRYTINVPADGDYFLWLRVKVPYYSNEVFGKYLSLYIGSDNVNFNACILMVNNQWQWQRITNLRLKKGKRTIDLKHKDFGFGIDQLFITATGLDLGSLGKNPTKEDILKANYNVPIPIIYPPLIEADGLGLDFPKPPVGHPRLFLREKDIPALKEKANDPFFKTCWEKIVSSSKDTTNGMLDAQIDGTANFTMSIINSIEAKALMYVLFKDSASGRKAINAMLNFFNTVKFNPSTSNIYVIYARFILADAIVYDWCYDLLNKEEKKTLIEWAETMASRMEIGWPVIRQGAVTGHGSDYQLMRDLISAGIATYDEKKDMYMLAAGRFFKYYVPARQFYYPSGYQHQGSSYGISRFVCEMWSTYIFDRMGYPKIFGEDQGKIPYFWTYLRRPDGQYLRDGDDFKEKAEFGSYWTNQGDALAGFYFKDPLLIGETMKQGGIGKGSDFLFDFLFYDSKVLPSTNKNNLPLTRYYKEPIGAMLARTGWGEGISSNTVVAQMKVGVYNFRNHQHLDAGNFQLYYKGPLAIESGIYEGAIGGYADSHDLNYNKRTIAHNSLLIYDPTEQNKWNVLNDGGQRLPNDGNEVATLELLLSRGCKTGVILAHKFGPDPMIPEYSYLKGDITLAYTSKVKQFQRSFVFLNLNNIQHPAVLIIFDKITSSNKDFKKYWLLHCVEEPVIYENTFTIKRSEKGYNGKMVNTALLPNTDNLNIIKVGGKGNEFTVFGKNFPQYYSNDKNAWDGAIWRIEITPKKPNLTDNFLNVMQVMDYKDGPEPLDVSTINSDQLVGTIIADRVVLFSKSGEKLSEKVSFTLSGNVTFKILVTDLNTGFWKIVKTGETTKAEYEVDKDSGILYFSGTEGKYVLLRYNRRTL